MWNYFSCNFIPVKVPKTPSFLNHYLITALIFTINEYSLNSVPTSKSLSFHFQYPLPKTLTIISMETFQISSFIVLIFHLKVTFTFLNALDFPCVVEHSPLDVSPVQSSCLLTYNDRPIILVLPFVIPSTSNGSSTKFCQRY